ncbi:hypothetical protein FQ085_15060 [Planococcus sp. ANT_H30]|uniref:hypothetical protein n=1 Tax=Planococcus sp. ANT_H30 TaxID=2597347 RepID=UPI0011EFF38B|nr:hypothetical protein [Planococcus sp. ANT_H30]KAA0955245.1 hypothetical protein FQ085_15060 [Planococcus sp. ANT_H30]
MKENFYKNPFIIIWHSKNNLMPLYLVSSWFMLLLISIFGTFQFDYFNFSNLSLSSHFSISSTGLTLTLALFVAGKAAFNDTELKILAQHKPKKDLQGQALINFLGPFVFTSMIFFLTGIVSLYAPYLDLNLTLTVITVFKIMYLNLLSLGFFSLFNLVITMLNDVYLKAFRTDKSE